MPRDKHCRLLTSLLLTLISGGRDVNKSLECFVSDDIILSFLHQMPPLTFFTGLYKNKLYKTNKTVKKKRTNTNLTVYGDSLRWSSDMSDVVVLYYFFVLYISAVWNKCDALLPSAGSKYNTTTSVYQGLNEQPTHSPALYAICSFFKPLITCRQ